MGKDILDISLNDIIKSARDKAGGLKDKVELEAEEIKKAWFKHVIGSIEKLSDRIELIRAEFRSSDRKIAELEARIKELEKHECKCGHDQSNDIRPDMPGRESL